MTPEDVCRAIVQLRLMGMWPSDPAMQGLADDAMTALETAQDGGGRRG
jgi:hypothetical protein